jgi:hypothetical protein
MEQPEESMQQIGAFEPSDAKRVLALLEAQQIPFEIEADNSALADPNRAIQLLCGLYPEGAKMIIFVPESRLPDAEAVLNRLFPV